jgi:hypothetical protein
VTGIGRSTCVTKTAEGLDASGDKRLCDAAEALDELRPENVEANLERQFDAAKSPFSERRSYSKGHAKHPRVVTHDQHQKELKQDKGASKRERENREKAWKRPD